MPFRDEFKDECGGVYMGDGIYNGCEECGCQREEPTPEPGDEPLAAANGTVKGAVVEMAAAEIGFGAALVFDPEFYDQLEMTEIVEMIGRVVQKWYERREFVHANLGAYNILVN